MQTHVKCKLPTPHLWSHIPVTLCLYGLVLPDDCKLTSRISLDWTSHSILLTSSWSVTVSRNSQNGGSSTKYAQTLPKAGSLCSLDTRHHFRQKQTSIAIQVPKNMNTMTKSDRVNTCLVLVQNGKFTPSWGHAGHHNPSSPFCISATGHTGSFPQPTLFSCFKCHHSWTQCTKLLYLSCPYINNVYTKVNLKCWETRIIHKLLKCCIIIIHSHLPLQHHHMEMFV